MPHAILENGTTYRRVEGVEREDFRGIACNTASYTSFLQRAAQRSQVGEGGALRCRQLSLPGKQVRGLEAKVGRSELQIPCYV
jgi:hypothetical protein